MTVLNEPHVCRPEQTDEWTAPCPVCCERCHERGLVESIIQAAEEAVANANPPGVPGIYRRDLEEAISDYRKDYLDA